MPGPFVNDGFHVVDKRDLYLEIARGNVRGYSFMSKFGQNEALNTSTYEDIWDGGGTYPYPTDGSAPITHIYSTAAETQPIEVQGLDIDGVQVVQTITLTGTTVAPLTTPLWRVFRLKNQGTTNNAGVIHASTATKSVSYAQIAIGNNQTLMALYTIPAGKTGYLCCGSASIAGTVRTYSIDGHMHMRPYGGVFQLKNTFGISSDGTGYFQHNFNVPLPMAERTDIKVEAMSTAANGVMNATFDIILIDN